MNDDREDEIRQAVRNSYGKVAEASNSGTSCGVGSSCCGVPEVPNSLLSVRLGYSESELAQVPDGADLGLGCGNPLALAAIEPGSVVVDLGSGAGFDCFLAALKVGPGGRVIGVDMTPSMISKARGNAAKGGYENVEFRLGEIEHLPVADNSVDLIISNCVINLSPDKLQVFRDAFRVLKPGGRLSISDVVALGPMPEEISSSSELYSACVSGASEAADVTRMLEQAGFADVSVEPKDESRAFIKDWAPGLSVEDYVTSAYIRGVKPG